jgi:type VI secretion system protein ImpL
MKAFFSALLSRWVLSFVGVAILAALVWFFAPFIGALAGIIPRALIILVLVLVWAGVNLLLDRRRRGRDAALEKGVAASQGDAQAGANAEEVAALSAKLTNALALLKKARGTRGYLYEQPWYVIIGPPGAGKTTALLNAGLKFPLAAEMGQGAVAGVGGTRLCDWWFTENAVLIDTAGRYTTQDSDASIDRAGWEGFLDLLKKTRARQPLNGVIVAIALSDIAAGTREERLGHARAIRRRIKEITEKLGVKIPVYLTVTKADLLAGFTEFFDDLDTERRAEVWGMTFPVAPGPQGPIGLFAGEYRQLVSRLDERLIDRLQAERSPERRGMIAGFPAQVASLEEPLGEFLSEAFAGSTLDPAPFLRGVYFSSGTQDGTPIDRLTGALARSFGIDQRRAPSLRASAGRSYFLGRLMRDVIFGEAMLASANPASVRRGFLLRAGGFAAVGLLSLALLAGLVISRSNNSAAITAAQNALAAEQKTAATMALDPVRDANLPAILPLLDQARDLPFGAGDQTSHGMMGLGLNQSGQLQTAAQAAYRNALDNIMLPRLLVQLEAEMRGGLSRPEFMYQATRVYLMLGNQGPLDKPLVMAWMNLDWQRLYPGPAAQPIRDDLMQHLTALLDQPLPNLPLDGGLVAAARATFSRVPIAERVYSRIRDSAQAASVPAWTPAEALGPAGTPLFSRVSGKPLTDGIPGFFTVRGFHFVLLPALSHAASDVASESWVLGEDEKIDPTSPQMQSLETDVIKLYEQDYAAHWNAMINDLTLAPFGSAGQAVQSLYILSSPQSPMRALLASMARQLTLSKAPTLPKGVKAPAVNLPGQAAFNKESSQLQGLLGAAPGAAPALPGSEIDAQFAPLRDYVGTGGPNAAGAPVDLTLQLLNQVQQQLAALAATAPGSGAPAAPAAGGDPASLLQGEAAHDPNPVSRWLNAIVATANNLRGGSAAQGAAAAFNGAGGPAQLCQQAVVGRYPFDPSASQGIPMGDFAHLFAPGGLLDQFFSTQVRPFVDMTGATWHVQAVNGVTPPVSQGAVAEFQRAQVIRQLFFASGGSVPSVQFSITPMNLSTGAAQVTLQLGALNVVYAHGPPVPTQISWPGSDGMQVARLIITPASGGNPVVLQATGPWALFRLFNQGSLRQDGSSDKYLLDFNQGGQDASFEIEAGSVFNPFAPGTLQDFRCPSLHG